MDSPNERKIFRQFIFAEQLAFSDLARKTKISTNLLAYFLKKMSAKGVLQKTGSGLYELSSKGEKLLPFYTEIESINPLVVVLVMVIRGKSILLLKRSRRPYRGLWSIISGRMLLGESIESAAERVCEKKLGVKCVFGGVSSVAHERLVEGETKHSFVFFVVRAKLESELNSGPLEGLEELGWFPLSRLPKNKMIASDYWLIKNKLSSRIDVVEEVLEKNGRSMVLLK